MIDWLVYLVSGGFVGVLLSFAIAMFKVGPGKPEFSFGKAVAGCLLLTYGGPFAYVEYQTRSTSNSIKPIIRDFYESSDCPLEGSLDYYKVLHATSSKAIVLVVGKERANWGGIERSILRVKLSKKVGHAKAKWEVTKCEVLKSDRLDKDNFVWPPYQ